MQGGNGGAFERIMLLLGEAHHALSSVKTADFRHLTSDEYHEVWSQLLSLRASVDALHAQLKYWEGVRWGAKFPELYNEEARKEVSTEKGITVPA